MAGATPGLTCGPRPARRWGSPHRRRTPPAARTRRSRPAAPTPRAGSPRTGRRGGRRPSPPAGRPRACPPQGCHCPPALARCTPPPLQRCASGDLAAAPPGRHEATQACLPGPPPFHAHRAHRLLPSLRIVRNWPRTPAERRRKLPEVLQEHAAGARSRAREAADFGGLGQRQLLVLHQVRDDHGRGPRYAALAVHQHRAARALLVDEVAGEIQAREHRLAPVVLDRDSMVRQVVVKDLPAANRADSADTAPSQTLPVFRPQQLQLGAAGAGGGVREVSSSSSRRRWSLLSIADQPRPRAPGRRQGSAPLEWGLHRRALWPTTLRSQPSPMCGQG
ncbi:unnamed protein product [Prorocentrum cordatum]|uniref:Uncharacterized protein n=1 Tax=Prorocentrum cordatum TaxID=2364126 RepID=A0ABN9VNY2_9DINO|nr:unnamed protein product [Polarella glacialis]